MNVYDCVVIGGGPAGMTAALYLLRSGLTVAWVEMLSPGGQTLLTEEIENYPGFPRGIKGYELADLLTEHVQAYAEDRLTKYMDEVKHIKAVPLKNEVQMAESTIIGKTLILASGSHYKRLGVEREEELTGRGVSYCALCDGNFFRNQDVVVVGGGNSALEESLYLAKLVNKLYLVHRRDKFRGAQVYVDKITSTPNVEVLYSHKIASLNGEPDLSSVTLAHVDSGEERTLDVTGCFVFIGFEPNSSYLCKEVETDTYGFIKTDTEMRTGFESIFAAGDIRSKRCRQVSTAVGDGATAANSAFIYLEEHNA